MDYLAQSLARFNQNLVNVRNETLARQIRAYKTFQDHGVLFDLNDNQKEFLGTTCTQRPFTSTILGTDRFKDGCLEFSRHLITFQMLQRNELALQSLQSPHKQEVIDFALDWCQQATAPEEVHLMKPELQAFEEGSWKRNVAAYACCTFPKALRGVPDTESKIGYLVADIYRLKQKLP